MNSPRRFGAVALLASMLAASAWAADKGLCRYNLKSTQLLQCRPIKLIENEDHKALWTFVEETKNEAVLAHILCRCETSAAGIQPWCEAPRSHKLTFTMETQDIRETCGQGPALCQEPCSKLISQPQ